MLNENCYRLIKIMVESPNDTITSRELAMLLNVSVKSVKNYVSLINYEEQIITPSSRGYKINKEDAIKILNSKTQDIPQNSKNRINYILNRILANRTNKPIDLFDLAEELMVSYETIQHDFTSIKHILSDYNLFIKVSNSRVLLDGSEKDKRRLFSKLISDEFSENMLSLDSLSGIFPKYDLVWLSTMIQTACKKYHYYINEYSSLSLLLEIMIGIERIKNGFELDYRCEINNYGIREKSLIQTIAMQIENKFSIEYSQDELGELANLLISYLIKAEPNNPDTKKTMNCVDSDCIEIVEELKALMDEWGFIDTNNEEFFIRFVLHVKNLIARLKNGYVTLNPLANQIRITYPLLFEFSVELAKKIKKITGYEIDNNEISYLALHIGYILQERNFIKNKINCICLFPQYYDYSTKLVGDISNCFNDKVIINAVITKYSELIPIKNYEMLLTTVPVSNHNDKRVLQISPFLNEKDKSMISSKIKEINLDKHKKNLKYELNKIMSQELFCKDKLFADNEEAIRFMVNKMAQLGYVDGSYINDVLEREKEASTAYGRIAIPHSFNMNAKKSSIFVFISSNGIKWGEAVVNIVMLFAINKKDRTLFYDLFDGFISNLLQIKNVNQVIPGSNIDEFISRLIDCIED